MNKTWTFEIFCIFIGSYFLFDLQQEVICLKDFIVLEWFWIYKFLMDFYCLKCLDYENYELIIDDLSKFW